ncbi:MAG: hypothetical protein GXY64_09290 [Bacteroidales bacterium]|nr:hypothetical protein [Bacteroidales bacterium]
MKKFILLLTVIAGSLLCQSCFCAYDLMDLADGYEYRHGYPPPPPPPPRRVVHHRVVVW